MDLLLFICYSSLELRQHGCFSIQTAHLEHFFRTSTSHLLCMKNQQHMILWFYLKKLKNCMCSTVQHYNTEPCLCELARLFSPREMPLIWKTEEKATHRASGCHC